MMVTSWAFIRGSFFGTFVHARNAEPCGRRRQDSKVARREIQQDSPSGCDSARAAHQLFDHPRVLDDPLALAIIGSEAAEKLRSSQKEAESSIARAFRAFIAARGRYAEDQLAKAIRQGVAQYVVLGAGLDTFACRNPYPLGLRVFEVDHPATQAWKRESLQRAGIEVPQSLVFAPVDFERQQLAAELARILLLARGGALSDAGIVHGDTELHCEDASGERRSLRFRRGLQVAQLGRARGGLRIVAAGRGSGRALSTLLPATGTHRGTQEFRISAY